MLNYEIFNLDKLIFLTETGLYFFICANNITILSLLQQDICIENMISR